MLLTVRRLVVVQVRVMVGRAGVVQVLPDLGRGAAGGRVVGGERGEGRSCEE